MPPGELRRSFDRVAAHYAAARPDYPAALIDDLVQLANLPPAGRLLEIGCGTGQAILPLAQRNFSILALELGPHLAALAAQRCAAYPRVEIRVLAFEDWPPELAAFDAVLAAQSIDWIPPEVALPRIAAALRPAGALALCWHDFAAQDTPLARDLAAIRRRFLPPAASDTPPPPDGEMLLLDSPLFELVATRRYPWSTRYDTGRYLQLIQTFSSFQAMSLHRQRQHLAAVRAAVERHGGGVPLACCSVLAVGRLRAAAP